MFLPEEETLNKMLVTSLMNMKTKLLLNIVETVDAYKTQVRKTAWGSA